VIDKADLRALPVFDTDLPAFDPSAAPDQPGLLFADWLRHAIDAGVREPHAMTLSTVDAEGRPDARTLILKGLEGDEWLFASVVDGPKGRQLAAMPAAALTFYWPQLGRQVRVRGEVTASDAAASAADFLARSPSARAEVFLGHQSEPMPDVDAARVSLALAVAHVGRAPELVAQSWTLFRVHADEVQFFQASVDRWHIRLRYTRTEEGWIRERIWP
jgi:pyridoxamine 5'-phosphate oxidase